MGMNKFEHYIMMLRRVSGTIGFGFIVIWIIFLSINQLMNSANAEDEPATNNPDDLQTVPQGCIIMGNGIIICDEPIRGPEGGSGEDQ